MIIINKVVLIGRLTADPLLKYTPGQGTAVTTITLAVDRQKTKEGKKEADFIPVVIWGKSAEATAQYMSKGKLIAIAGRIQTRSYDHKDGYKVYVTEVVAEDVQFLEWGKKDGDENYSSSGDFDNMTPVDDGDIPF